MKKIGVLLTADKSIQIAGQFQPPTTPGDAGAFVPGIRFTKKCICIQSLDFV